MARAPPRAAAARRGPLVNRRETVRVHGRVSDADFEGGLWSGPVSAGQAAYLVWDALETAAWGGGLPAWCELAVDGSEHAPRVVPAGDLAEGMPWASVTVSRTVTVLVSGPPGRQLGPGEARGIEAAVREAGNAWNQVTGLAAGLPGRAEYHVEVLFEPGLMPDLAEYQAHREIRDALEPLAPDARGRLLRVTGILDGEQARAFPGLDAAREFWVDADEHDGAPAEGPLTYPEARSRLRDGWPRLLHGQEPGHLVPVSVPGGPGDYQVHGYVNTGDGHARVQLPPGSWARHDAFLLAHRLSRLGAAAWAEAVPRPGADGPGFRFADGRLLGPGDGAPQGKPGSPASALVAAAEGDPGFSQLMRLAALPQGQAAPGSAVVTTRPHRKPARTAPRARHGRRPPAM